MKQEQEAVTEASLGKMYGSAKQVTQPEAVKLLCGYGA